MLIISDRKALEEALEAQAGTQMMNGKGMGMGQDYNGIFKAEKENFEIINWKSNLDDVEEAFLAKYS
jgi:ribosomal protein L27